MAPKKLFPPSLEDSCLTQILIFLKNIARNHSQNVEIQEEKLTQDLSMVIKFVPPPVQDKVASLHLRGVKGVFGEDDDRKDSYAKDGAHVARSFYRGEMYFNCLMSIIGQLKVKTMHMNDWPKYMQVKLADFLEKMTWLQDFSCAGLKVDDKTLSNACLQFTNLSSFSLSDKCTDEMLSVLCANSKMLCIINVEQSISVTDACISNLVDCENLQKVYLGGTGVSSDGYFRLLNDSKSIFLYKIGGLERNLDKVLDKMELLNPLHRFKLKYLQCRNIGKKHLGLAVKYFPFVTKLFINFVNLGLFQSIFLREQNVPAMYCNLAVLSQLEHLKEVKFRFWFCPYDDVYEALSTAPFVTSIEFSKYTTLLTGFLLSIVFELCPGIEELRIEEVVDDRSSSEYSLSRPSCTNSFEKLTALLWACPTLEYVQDVLRNAPNIETLRFELYSKPAFSDKVFEYIFNHNQLNQLKELKINCPNNTLSSNMMKLIIVNCKQLKFFEIYSPVLCKNLSELSDFIVQNNYDVDFIAHNYSGNDDNGDPDHDDDE